MKSLYYKVFILLLGIILSSCGENKQSQSNLNSLADDDKQYALSLYGDEVKILAKGDLLGNGKISAIAAIVRKQADNSWWIQRGSIIEKDDSGWKVLLRMEEKLSSTKGDLVSQVDAKNGYIISFDTSKKPLTINIVMANEYGKGTSDEAQIKWNKDKAAFEFATPYEDIPQ
jgi:hypothetical protein